MVETLQQQPAICIDSATWHASLMKWRMAKLREELEWEAYKALPKGHRDKELLSDLCSESSDAEATIWQELIATPSPDLSALRWKLDQVMIVDQDEDHSAAWAGRIVRHVISDFQRLLPEAV